ncbi:hypothetical protein BKA83DRAFT_4280955, partial [Pisolithus microcarpus]
SISATQRNTILTMLDAGHSASSIASSTGLHLSTISRLHSKEHSMLATEHSTLQNSTGGCPSKLSPANVTKTLTNIINQPLHPNTVWQHLKKTGMKAMVKHK